MRRFLIISAALLSTFGAGIAHAQNVDGAPSTEATSSIAINGEFAVATSYLDTLFNDRITNKPFAQLAIAIEFRDGFYVAPYVFTGFDRPFNDDNSEYGLEVGVEREVGNGIMVNVAGGRYANYFGEGFGAGDWYGRIGATYENASLSVTGLSGDSDTFVVNATYEAELAEGFTLTPSVAYVTSTGAINPSITTEVEVAKGFAFRLNAMLPETDTGREAYAAVGLVFRF